MVNPHPQHSMNNKRTRKGEIDSNTSAECNHGNQGCQVQKAHRVKSYVLNTPSFFLKKIWM